MNRDPAAPPRAASTAAAHGREILIVVQNNSVPFDRRVWMEACALRDAGYRVTVICPADARSAKRREVLEGIRILRHPRGVEGDVGLGGFLIEFGVTFFWECLLAWWTFLRRRPAVIHLCNPPDHLFLLTLPLKAAGAKVIFDQHDIAPAVYRAKRPSGRRLHGLLTLLERLSYRTADLVIATNQSYARYAQEHGVPAAKVRIVRTAPDTTRFRPVPADAELKRGHPLLVAYLGTMGKQDGVDLLLHAARRLRDSGREDVGYTLIGGGPQKQFLEDLAERLDLGDRVHFTGRISDHDLLRHLSTADVCVNPDYANELNDMSTMTKIMEYMALGKPIVQFDVTEGRFSAQEASLYAEPNDVDDLARQIARLLDDPAERRRMGELGRRRVEEQLDWRFSRRALEGAYASLIGPLGAPTAHDS